MNEPLKRHKALQSLSRDHHDGLILAQLAKKDSPEYSQLPKTVAGKIEYAVSYFYDELVPHFRAEENILFPFMQGKDKEIDELVHTIVEEHRRIKSLVTKIDEESNEDALDELGHLIESHIRKEERELFPKIQDLLSEDELTQLGNKLPKISDEG